MVTAARIQRRQSCNGKPGRTPIVLLVVVASIIVLILFSIEDRYRG
jgi:hypothetical protein